MNKNILAIDTSCDDTAAAVVNGTTVLSNIIASQTQLHKPYGGVFPTVAKQAHKENINRVIELALKRAQVDWKDIEAIAVTQGPGLAPALEVGINKARQLASELNKPLIAVNHTEGHLLSVLAERKKRSALGQADHKANQQLAPNFPALAVIISGGHSEFILVNEIGDYQRLGGKIDDAAGEALDKVGRVFGLGYPAGPIIEEFAKKASLSGQALNDKQYKFPLPLTTQKNFNLSFSGLKTFARNLIEKIEAQKTLTKQEIYDLSASFQYAVFRHICYKLNKILEKHQVREIWLGGGVAANMELRRMIRETVKQFIAAQISKNKAESKQLEIKLRTPYSQRLCVDNAAMIGVVAGYKLARNKVVKVVEQLDRKPRWKVG